MHELKVCPSCNAVFECKAGNISQCQCYGIGITEAARQQIERLFDDCLCAACMKKFNSPTAVLPLYGNTAD